MRRWRDSSSRRRQSLANAATTAVDFGRASTRDKFSVHDADRLRWPRARARARYDRCRREGGGDVCGPPPPLPIETTQTAAAIRPASGV